MPAVPGVHVDLDELIALEHRGRGLSFLPRQRVHSVLSGRYASRMRGRGLNFEEIRDYRAGDDVRSIDWKVTARLRAPHIRVFNEERDRQAVLVIDQRLTMFFGSRLAMKSVTAAQAAAIVAWRILGGGDRVGGIVFTDTGCVELRPQRSRRNVLGLLRQVVAQNQALGVGRGIVNAPAMLNRAIDRAQRLALHDAIVIILSDFDGADESTRRMVGGLAVHNDVVALLVHDPMQSELPPAARDSVRRSLRDATEERLRDVLSWSREIGVPVLPLSAAEEPAAQLQRLLGANPTRQGRAGRTAGAAHG
jgi:uncharacterized protein (DUF58 family)